MDIITQMTGVFTDIMTWIISALQSVIGIFWNETSGLTFLGVLTLVALGISIFLLLMRIIADFIHLRR